MIPDNFNTREQRLEAGLLINDAYEALCKSCDMLESFLGKYFESTDPVEAAQILTNDYANACLIYNVACDLLLHARSELNAIGGFGDMRLLYENQDSLHRIQALEVDKLTDEIQAATGNCHRPPFAVVKKLKEIGRLPDTEAIPLLRAYQSSLSDTGDSENGREHITFTRC